MEHIPTPKKSKCGSKSLKFNDISLGEICVNLSYYSLVIQPMLVLKYSLPSTTFTTWWWRLGQSLKYLLEVQLRRRLQSKQFLEFPGSKSLFDNGNHLEFSCYGSYYFQRRYRGHWWSEKWGKLWLDAWPIVLYPRLIETDHLGVMV